jgi:hypothetical protein
MVFLIWTFLHAEDVGVGTSFENVADEVAKYVVGKY